MGPLTLSGGTLTGTGTGDASGYGNYYFKLGTASITSTGNSAINAPGALDACCLEHRLQHVHHQRGERNRRALHFVAHRRRAERHDSAGPCHFRRGPADPGRQQQLHRPDHASAPARWSWPTAAGSATGNNTVTLNGGMLAAARAGGTILGPVAAGSSPHPSPPGRACPPAYGTLNLNGGLHQRSTPRSPST